MHIMLGGYTIKSVNLEFKGYHCNISVTFSYQQTPLHLAASNAHDYTVEWLVKKGADMNIKDKKGVSETVTLVIVL